ncbi:hypothetical protein ACKKBF_B02815 [Auxenochlorella protothecoides x Auxenochlorella symbiontica]
MATPGSADTCQDATSPSPPFLFFSHSANDRGTPPLRGGPAYSGNTLRSSTSKLSTGRPERLRMARRSLPSADSMPSPSLLASPAPSVSSCVDDASGEEVASGGEGVRVMVRVRPPNRREQREGGAPALSLVGPRTLVLTEPSRLEPVVKSYDHVFGCESTQEEVYAVAGAPVVEHCMAGFNSSIFAYGQTGAGKTHTMMGEACASEAGGLHPDCGLTLRVFAALFRAIEDVERGEGPQTLRYRISCSFLEIYNEEITDLLAPGPALQIRDGDVKRGVYVQDLSEHNVLNADDVMVLIQRGSENRHIAATRMNERSSRSHSVFTCTIEATERADTGITSTRTSKLNLIDLAGSERVGRSGARGDQLTEARSINKSLTVLGRVISALVERQKRPAVHVPYRDSRLTFLLQESLGGNSKTSVVACVTPAAESATESLSTLLFASGAKKIRNRAVVNEESGGDLRALQQENARLVRLVSELQLRARRAETGVDGCAGLDAGGRFEGGRFEGGGGGGAAPRRLPPLLLPAAAAGTAPPGADLPAALPSPSLGALRAELERLRATHADTSKEVTAARAALEAELERNAALETVFDQNNVAISLLRAEAEALRRELDGERGERARAAARADAARDEAAALAAEAAGLRDAAAEAEAERDAAACEAEALRAALAAAGARAAAGDAALASAAALEARLEEERGVGAALRQELEVAARDARTASADAAAAAEELGRLRRVAGEDAALAGSRAGRLQQENEELYATMQVLRRDGDTLRAELAAQTVTVAKYKRMVGEISRLIDWAQCGLGRRAGEGAKPSLARMSVASGCLPPPPHQALKDAASRVNAGEEELGKPGMLALGPAAVPCPIPRE